MVSIHFWQSREVSSGHQRSSAFAKRLTWPFLDSILGLWTPTRASWGLRGAHQGEEVGVSHHTPALSCPILVPSPLNRKLLELLAHANWILEGAPGPQFSCTLSSSLGPEGHPALTEGRRLGECSVNASPVSRLKGRVGKRGRPGLQLQTSIITAKLWTVGHVYWRDT